MKNPVEKLIRVLQFKHPDKKTNKNEPKSSSEKRGERTQEKDQRRPSPRWAYEF
jgi:hypothetical protein